MNANGKLTRGHLESDSSNCCDFSGGFVGRIRWKRVKSPLQNAGKGGESSPKKRRLTTKWEAKAKVSCSPNAADQSGM